MLTEISYVRWQTSISTTSTARSGAKGWWLKTAMIDGVSVAMRDALIWRARPNSKVEGF